MEFCRGLRLPDFVLMDVQMPIMNGVEATGIIKAEHPEIKVVMLTVSADDEHLFGAIQSGAQGYLLKDTPSRQLRDRMRSVTKGQGTLSGIVTEKVIRKLNEQDSAPYAAELQGDLSERDRQVIALVAEGLSNEEIGKRLFISPATVKKQISTLLLRLGLENRVQLAVYAVKAGICNE